MNEDLPLARAQRRLHGNAQTHAQRQKAYKARKKAKRLAELQGKAEGKTEGLARGVQMGAAAGMKAAGVPYTRVADVMGVLPETARAWVQEVPGLKDKMQGWRLALKELKLQRAHDMEGDLWARAKKEVESGGAKDVDAIFRSLLSSEKIQAAAAGEGNASGAPGGGTTGSVVDLRVLIQQLAGD